MQSNNTDADIHNQIRRLIQTIDTVQKARQEDWIPWKAVAKYQEGSEELAPVLSGLAALPEAALYFRLSRDSRFVSLTAAAQTLLWKSELPAESDPEKIARAVKAYARQLTRLRFKVSSITFVGKTERRTIHAVNLELGDAVIPNDAPVMIVSTEWGTRASGRIVGQDADKGVLYVALESRFENADLPATIEVDRAFLLYKLAESIAKLPEIPSLGRAFMDRDPKATLRLAHSDSNTVAEMLATHAVPWTRFLWGPPGAGKTYCIARLVCRLLEQDPNVRILLVAPSNVAVDVALSQLVEQLKASARAHLLNERRILRYGYPRGEEILSRPELLGSEAEQEVSRDIAEKGTQLRSAIKNREPEEQQVFLRAELLELQEKLKDLVLGHVIHCQVVATTAAMTYSPANPIAAQQWDAVLVDEVTMVPPAICLYLSSLARNRLLLAGDPRQLGPIFEARQNTDADAVNWMGRDAYDFAQLSIGEGEARRVETDDPRLVRITSQRRIAKDIWRIIEHLYPDVASNVDEQKLTRLREVSPVPGQGVVLVDVGKELRDATCEQAHNSWQNPKTGELATKLARQILSELGAKNGSVLSIAIITPYRAQYRLLKQGVKQDGSHEWVTTGTIHQFQGSEADIVIFDMVDGPNREKLGLLLRGDTGLRLINVAISRARGKFIILANREWCRKTMTRSQNPILWDIIMADHGREHVRTTTKATKEQDWRIGQTYDVAAPDSSKREEPPCLIPDDPDAQWIHQLAVGEACRIPSMAVKRNLNQTLSRMRLKSSYIPFEHETIWEGAGKRFCVDHNAELFRREK